MKALEWLGQRPDIMWLNQNYSAKKSGSKVLHSDVKDYSRHNQLFRLRDNYFHFILFAYPVAFFSLISEIII